MYLRNLVIEANGEIIRDIDFHPGLNLIIDETDTENFKESGNNVGKTTVLRLVDYCFDGSGENIYKDSEFDNEENLLIKNFLEESEVIISMTLADDFSDHPSNKIQIRRNFLAYSEKILEINGISIKAKDFDEILKEKLFNFSSPKPTLRQIVAKHIRDESNKLVNAIRILPYATFEEYEALYFFWLGIDNNTGERKIRLSRQKTKEKDHKRRLTRERSKGELEQTISILDKDIESLERQKSNFNVNPNYEEDLNSLNKIKKRIGEVSQMISESEIRVSLIEESRELLESEYSEIDVDQLKSLYAEASASADGITKKFEELVQFHSQLLQDRIEFITQELPSLKENHKRLNAELIELIEAESVLKDRLKKSGALEELEELAVKLNNLYEYKGSLENQLDQIEASNKKLIDIEEELGEIEQGIDNIEELVNSKVRKFNTHFTDLSGFLYGEKFILVPNRTERAYKLEIKTLLANPGTGRKKGVITAFDMAHMMFCDEEDISTLRFVMYDQLENLHGNQLGILDELAEKANAQIITSILADKLPEKINTHDYSVITLSESDKLFGLN